jgi:mono/diheme cytochrome c family protein
MKQFFFALACCAGMTLSSAQESNSIQRGKQLFRGSASLSQAPAVQNVPMPASISACANCHGLAGQGVLEAGSFAPPITARALLLPKAAAQPYRSVRDALVGLSRGLGRTLTTGPVALAANMPRYEFTESEADDIASYLEVLGTDSDVPSGVTKDRIRIATILPTEGIFKLAAQEIEAGLRNQIAVINASGGIYGRKLELQVQALSGQGLVERQQALATAEASDAYALVGVWQPLDSAEAPTGLPMVGSLGFAPTQRQARLQRHLMPSLQDQINELLRRVSAQCSSGAGSSTVLHNGQLAVLQAIEQSDLKQRADIGLIQFNPNQLPAATTTVRPWLLALGVSTTELKNLHYQSACIAHLAALSGLAQTVGVDADTQLTLLPIPQALIQPGDLPFWARMGQLAVQLLADALSRAGHQLDDQSLQRVFDSTDRFELGNGVAVGYSKKIIPGMGSTLMTGGGSYVSYSN